MHEPGPESVHRGRITHGLGTVPQIDHDSGRDLGPQPAGVFISEKVWRGAPEQDTALDQTSITSRQTADISEIPVSMEFDHRSGFSCLRR
jgi:hypothetical protein